MQTERPHNTRALVKEGSLRLVALLRNGPMTYNAIERALYAEKYPVLRTHIQKLRRDGMLDRILTKLEPVEISWGLTPLGAEFAKRADSLIGWLDAHRDDVIEARECSKQRQAEMRGEVEC
jgi:DNA-binding HxlR family transcriptional regulator